MITVEIQSRPGGDISIDFERKSGDNVDETSNHHRELVCNPYKLADQI